MPSHSEDVAATPQQCFDALVDFDSYPQWQSVVLSAEVRARDEGARTVDVAFEVDLRLRRVRYVLRYHLAPPSRITWSQLEGDVHRIEGGYTLEPTGDGTTLATYEVDIDPGFPVPGFVRRRLIGDTMRRSVRELKMRVESAG